MVKGKKIVPIVEVDDNIVNPDFQSAGEKTLVCVGCPYEKNKRVCGTGSAGDAPVDVMYVSEAPSLWSTSNQKAFYGRGGRVIRDTRDRLITLDNKTGKHYKFAQLRYFDTYAIQCQVAEGREEAATIPKSVITRCSAYLRSAIRNKRPKVILAFGLNAYKALGFAQTDKFTELRGRVFETEIGGHVCKVLPTFSTKHLIAKTGLYNLFYNDFIRAMKIASGADDVKPLTVEEISKNYRFASTVEDVKAICDEIIDYAVPGMPAGSLGAVAVDTETNTLHPHRKDARVLCVSFAWDSGKATAIPMWHSSAPWSDVEMVEVIGHVRRVLACRKPKIFHNSKFDLKFLELRHKLTVNNVAWDTMLGEHLLREDQQGSYSLKVLGRSYFPAFASYADKVHELAAQLTPEEENVAGITDSKIRRGRVKAGTEGFDDGFEIRMTNADLAKYLHGSKAKKSKRKKDTMDAGYERVPLPELLKYAAIDTDLTRRLTGDQFNRMRREKYAAAKTLMTSHALPASRTLGKMEFRGMRVDRPYLDVLEKALTITVETRREIMQQYWDGFNGQGVEFNANSAAHLGHMLYDCGIVDEDGKKQQRHIKNVTTERTKSGQWKTDKKTLGAIAEQFDCPFTKALLEYRSAHKALAGFIDDIRILSEYDGYLHTNFNLHGTSTGRLSSSDLNMQNLPGYLAGHNIKKIFLPDADDELIFDLDWKGAEIRIFTAYAGDQKLIDALNQGLDVHSLFTQEIYGIPYEEVANHERLKGMNKERYLFLKKTRTNVKRVVFGILYGAKGKKISETAGIPIDEAEKIIDLLFARFPSIKNYIDATHRAISENGYVETFFARRRRFPLVAVNGFFRGQAERRGVNMKIQSTSSDIVLGQLVEIDDHIAELGGRLCVTVHDSIAGTVKRKYIEQLPAFLNHYCVKRVAEKYPWLPVAFEADTSVGPNYGETIALEAHIKQERERPKTADELLFNELDKEAVNELREDPEEEIKRREAETTESRNVA